MSESPRYEVRIVKKQRVTRIGPRRWLLQKEGGEYGYADPVEETVEEETEMLRQTVDNLDLAAVIKAVNGL